MKQIRLFLVALLTCVCLSSLSAQNTLYLHGAQAMPGDTVQLSLSLSATEGVSSFEADITLPQGLTLLEATPCAAPATDHVVRLRSLSSGRTVHVVCWSPTNALLGRRASLSVAVAKDTRKGSYSLSLSGGLLVTPDGVSLAPEVNTARVEVNTDGPSGTFASYLADAQASQAWCLRNTDTDLYLHANRTAGTLTMEKQAADSPCQRFFLEPAYDRAPDAYYLRNTDGFYLNSTLNGSSYDLSLTSQPSATSAFTLVETGDRTYSLLLDGSTKRLAASETTIGSEVRASSTSTLCHWQFLKTDADHVSYLERLCTTTAHYVGLTQGQADYDLRLLRHNLSMALIDGMDEAQAVASIDELSAAANAAYYAWQEGDTTIIDRPWMAAEMLSSSDKVITTTDASGQLLFLTLTEGQLGLSDQFSVIAQQTSAPVLQDAFYNPYTDCCALRLSGSDPDGSGTYLTLDPATGELRDTVVQALSASLSQWTVLSFQQAVGSYLTLSGKSGTSVSWDFDLATRTLTFSGQLRTHTYGKPEGRPWHLYRSLIHHVVFAGRITLLGANLLADCTNIESLTFISGTKPTTSEGTFDGLPSGIAIYAPNPEAYDDFLPDCQTYFLVKMQDTYVYDGTRQTPIVAGAYDAAVTVGLLEQNAGTYTSDFTLSINIDGKVYEHTCTFTYTILPAPLTFAVRDASRNYGSKNPSFQVMVSGLKGTDNEKSVVRSKADASCEADEMSPIGTYSIWASGGELCNSNYVPHYQHGTLTVRPKTLSIIADNQTRYADEPNPPFTYTCIGFANGEDESVLTEWPVLSCEADSTSAPGKYPITVSGGAAPNYTIKSASGVLTILEGSRVEALDEGRRTEDGGRSEVYDLLGRRVSLADPSVSSLPSGIYIINGKKIIIK